MSFGYSAAPLSGSRSCHRGGCGLALPACCAVDVAAAGLTAAGCVACCCFTGGTGDRVTVFGIALSGRASRTGSLEVTFAAGRVVRCFSDSPGNGENFLGIVIGRRACGTVPLIGICCVMFREALDAVVPNAGGALLLGTGGRAAAAPFPVIAWRRRMPGANVPWVRCQRCQPS